MDSSERERSAGRFRKAGLPKDGATSTVAFQKNGSPAKEVERYAGG